MRLGFRYSVTLPQGASRNGGQGPDEFILPQGIVLTARNPDFMPVIGYLPGRGLDEDNRTAPRLHPPGWHEGLTPGDADRSLFEHRLRITAPAAYTVNSTGVLTDRDERDGRVTWTWESDAPVRVWNVIAGPWEEKSGGGAAVFYDPAHPYNVDVLHEALLGARRHFSAWFHPYPWRDMRLSEFPAIATYARGNATNIFFSEGMGFLTRKTPRVDFAFEIAAHEAAHSWWGHIVSPGAGPGGAVIAEGGAHFATLMLLEEMRGTGARRSLARRLERDYGEFRQPSLERPLAEITWDRPADALVIYNKGGWALWMLMNHLGRERFLVGVRNFFERYHRNPDHPVTHDFLAVLRQHAADAETVDVRAYDEFVATWFHSLAVPEYRVTATKEALGEACVDCVFRVAVEVMNAGGGRMPVTVAALRGENGEAEARECRGVVSPGAGEVARLELECGFEPERVVVDPDVEVLQLQRRSARVRLR